MGRNYDEHDRHRASSTTSERRSRYDDDDRGQGSRRGFAAMDPERQREIASMGGRASQGGRGRDWDGDDRGYARHDSGYEFGSRSAQSRYDDDDHVRESGSARRGFAAMDAERQREISSLGGRAGHGGPRRDWDDDDRGYSSRSSGYGPRSHASPSRYDNDDDDRDSGRSRRGFAVMDPERRREISSLGGRASHGGR